MKNKKTSVWLLAVALVCALFVFCPQAAVAETTPDWVKTQIANDSPAEGTVKTYNAIITEDDTFANKWKVQLLVAARNQVTTADVVLCIDVSGSMGDYQRLEKAKDAANDFVTQVLGNSTSSMRVGVVSYGEKATVASPLTNNQEQLHTAINGLSANDGTYTQDGLHQAREMLKNSQASQKYIIILSDGEPTYSAKFKDIDYTTGATGNFVQFKHGLIIKYLESTRYIKEYNFDYAKRAGDGQDVRKFYRIRGVRWYYFNHGNSAIAEAGFAKRDGIEVFSIGLSTNRTGRDILKKIANSDDGHFVEAKNPNDLQGIYSDLAQTIIYAANAPSVDMSFGKGFVMDTVNTGGQSVTDVKASPGTTYEPSTNKWTIDAIDEPVVLPGQPNIFYEYLEFTMTVENGVLDYPGITTGQEIKPFEATLSYTDSEGNPKEMTFSTDDVKVTLYASEKVIDATNDAWKDDKFTFNIDEQNGDNWKTIGSFKLSAKDTKTVLKGIKHGKTYRVYETTTGVDGSGDFNVADRYETKTEGTSGVTIGDSNVENGFRPATIKVKNKGESDYQKVTFSNTEKRDGKLTVTKKLDGVDENAYLSADKYQAKFAFRVTGPKNYLDTFTLAPGESKALTNLPYGEYTVEETSSLGFTPSYSVSGGKVTLVPGTGKEQAVTVTNGAAPTVDVTATKVWVDRPSGETTSADIELTQTASDGTKTTITDAPQVGNDIYTWKGLPKYDNALGEYRYAVAEKNVTNGRVEINGHTYQVTQKGNTITNKYVPKDCSLKVEKKFAEGIDNPNASFSFKVTGPTGKVVDTFSLKAGEGKDISNLEAGTYVVTETENAGYVPTFSASDGKTDGSIELTASGKNGTVTVTNGSGDGKDKTVYTATKIWENKPADAEYDAPFVLQRKVEGGDFVDVTGDAAGTLQVIPGTTTDPNKIVQTYKWTNIDKYDEESNQYIYAVRENGVDGYNEVTIDNDTYTVAQEGDTVTNTYKPTGSITIKKVLEAGTVVSDDTTFYFSITGDALKKPIETKVLAGGTAVVEELPDGTYTVTETNATGFIPSYDPAGGVVTINKDNREPTVTVTNGSAQTDDIVVKKIWKNSDGFTKPDVTVVLKKTVNGQTSEVAKRPLGSDDSVHFGKQDKVENGAAVTYTVDEELSFVDEAERANWEKSIANDKFEITNSVIQKPTDTKLTISKEVLTEKPDGTTEPAQNVGDTFEIRVQGPNFDKTYTLGAGGKEEISNLYYGTYTVTEKTIDGYTASYSKEQVVLKPEHKTDAVTVTNTIKSGVPTPVDPDEELKPRFVQKVWDEKSDPLDLDEAPLVLYRIDPKTNEEERIGKADIIAAKSDKEPFTYLYSWNPQPVYNADKQEYQYRVKEEGVKDGQVVIGKNIYKVESASLDLPSADAVIGNENDMVTFKNTFVGKKPGGDTPDPGTKPHDHGSDSDGDYSGKINPSSDKNKDDGKEPPELNKQDHFAYLFGYPDNGFHPNGYITRAEVTSMFARLLVNGMDENETFSNEFSDVPEDEWYANTVGFMSEQGIIKGYDDGTFRPNAPVTRAEFAAIASRFDKLTEGESNFPDVPADHWAKTAIDFAFTKGWVNGYEDGTFRPENSQTRAETVAIVNKMLERKADQNFIREHDGEIIHFADVFEGYWAYWEIIEATNGHDYERSGNGIDETWLRLKDYKKNF